MKAKNIQILFIISLYIFSCTKFDLPEKCNDAIPTNLLLKGSTFPSEIVLSKNDVNPLTITTEGNYTLNWTITGAGANVVYTGVGQSASLLKTYPNGIYVVKATGKNSCGFNFTIEKTIKFCVDSSPADINITVNADRTATCTLVAGGSQKVDWTLVDKALNTSILVATGTDKATIDPVKYPSGNYILKATGKSECNIDFTLTKDYSNDYFDIFAVGENSKGVGINDIATDLNGNIYVTGVFSGQWTTSKKTLISVDGSNDVFVAKYTKFGILEWIQSAGGVGYDESNSIAVDANGNVYITGSNNNNISFGTSYTLQNSRGCFLVKFNVNGVAQWVTGLTADSSTGNELCLDSKGNVYLMGYFTSNLITFADNTFLSGIGGQDIFVIKIDPSSLKMKWKKVFGGKGFDYCTGIAVDLNDNVYVTGYSDLTNSPLNIISGSVNKYGSYDIFLVQFKDTGEIGWIQTAGGTNSDYATSISVDGSNNVYIAGGYSGTINFGSKSVSSTNTNSNAFITKYNDLGSVQWVQSSKGTKREYPSSLVTDIDGRSYLMGYFEGSTNFGTFTNQSIGQTDIFITKYSKDGDVQKLETLGGVSYDYPRSITLDAGKNVYAVGLFQEVLNYKAKKLSTSGSNSDSFILRLDK